MHKICRAETSVLQLSALWQDYTLYLGYVCSKLLPSMPIDIVAAKLMQVFFFFDSWFGILCCSYQKPSHLRYQYITEHYSLQVQY